MKRFEGTCEELCPLKVDSLVKWVTAIPLEEWPQQNIEPGRTTPKPAMVNDPGWRGFGEAIKLYLDFFRAKYGWQHLQNPMLSVVMPGDIIGLHIDQMGPDWRVRVHVPLLTNSQSFTLVVDKRDYARPWRYHLETGTSYLINPLQRHSVLNLGETPRIHWMFDVHER